VDAITYMFFFALLYVHDQDRRNRLSIISLRIHFHY